MTVRVYGQAPGPGQADRPGVPFSGSSRLTDLAGVTPEQLVERGWQFRNLLDYYPGPSENGDGDLFPMGEARPVAEAEHASWEEGDRILLMGRQVATAFRVYLPYLVWVPDYFAAAHPGVDVAVVPHPSGRNRYWNQRAQIEAARRFLRETVEAYA